MNGFGERLRELRLERNLSSVQLGKELGVSGPTIIRWENETILPTIEKLFNIAKFFGVTSDFLIGLED